MKIFLTMLLCLYINNDVNAEDDNKELSRISNQSYIKGYGDRSIEMIELCRVIHDSGAILPKVYQDRISSSLDALNRKDFDLPVKKEMENEFEQRYRIRFVAACTWAIQLMVEDKEKWPRITNYLKNYE